MAPDPPKLLTYRPSWSLVVKGKSALSSSYTFSRKPSARWSKGLTPSLGVGVIATCASESALEGVLEVIDRTCHAPGQEMIDSGQPSPEQRSRGVFKRFR